MYSLLVLGLVPGTNFQITFTFWVQCVEALLLAAILAKIGLRFVKSGRRGILRAIELRDPLGVKQLHR